MVRRQGEAVSALLATVLAACAAPHPLVHIEEGPFVLSAGPSPSQRLARTATLGLGSGSTPIERMGPGRRVPLVHARVGGQPTLMLLDTGAYDHVVEGWFVRQLQDSEATGAQGLLLDHANRVVPVERWSELSLVIDGWPPLPPIHPFTTGDMNPWPRAFGIGGILSPQRLSGGSAVVVDFPAGEMAVTDSTSAAMRLSSHPRSLGVAFRCGAGYGLTATIAGHAARLLVDTGATQTDLKSSSEPGQALAGRSSVSHDLHAIGGAVGARMLEGATVTVGDLSTRLDVSLVSDSPRALRCPNDGVLGMDVLSDCVVVIDGMRMTIACG